MIKAIIQPYRLDHVRKALTGPGVIGMSVSECSGHGREGLSVASLKTDEQVRALFPKVMIEIAVPATKLAEAMEAIKAAARVGNAGDGKIFVSTIERAVHIRTGQEDGAAL